jgi:hypothetical protein
VVVDGTTASQVVEGLLAPDIKEPDDRWKDPTHVATTNWRSGVLERIADPEVGSDRTVLVELELNHPHPAFYAIVRVDELGLWYSDGDGSVADPIWRLRLLPWRHIELITLHQAS